MLQINTPERFMKFLQGGILIGNEWLPPNQARRIINLQDTCFFVSGSPSFVRKLWGGGINKDMMTVLMSLGSRVRKFRERYGTCQIVDHHRVGPFGNSSIEAILTYGNQGS